MIVFREMTFLHSLLKAYIHLFKLWFRDIKGPKPNVFDTVTLLSALTHQRIHECLSLCFLNLMSNIELTRSLNMAELRKLRRQFISYTKMHPTENIGHIANMFVQYLNKSIHWWLFILTPLVQVNKIKGMPCMIYLHCLRQVHSFLVSFCVWGSIEVALLVWIKNYHI